MNNTKFIETALKLLKPPMETRVEVVRTIRPRKDNQIIESEVVEDYRKKELKKGDEVVLDFGNHYVGYLNLAFSYKGSHPDAPVLVRVHFAENLVELFENPNEYQGWICSSWIEKEEFHLDLIPGEKHFERRYAFRYVKIQIIDISSKFRLIINSACCTALSGVREDALMNYSAKSELHGHLDQVACRTLKNCMQTVFEDGPKRDQRLWMGDLRIQARVNYVTYQENDMVKACLYLFAGLPMEHGKMGACLFLEPKPEVDDTDMFDYSLFFINTLYDYYLETKDLYTLKELWPTALRQIEIAKECLNEQDIVADSNRLGWCFVDWNLNLNKQASAQGILLYAILAAMKISHILEDEKAEEELTALYECCKRAANHVLWDECKQCYVSGENKQISMASQVWMILGGAIEGTDAMALINRVEALDGCEGMVTPYMYHNYIDALILCGNKERAFEQMEYYWGGMLQKGADTFWELYNPDNPDESPYGGTIVNSYCHAWSCGPAYFLRKYGES